MHTKNRFDRHFAKLARRDAIVREAMQSDDEEVAARRATLPANPTPKPDVRLRAWPLPNAKATTVKPHRKPTWTEREKLEAVKWEPKPGFSLDGDRVTLNPETVGPMLKKHGIDLPHWFTKKMNLDQIRLMQGGLAFLITIVDKAKSERLAGYIDDFLKDNELGLRNKMIRFGVHKGKTFGELAETEEGLKYLDWLNGWDSTHWGTRIQLEMFLSKYQVDLKDIFTSPLGGPECNKLALGNYGDGPDLGTKKYEVEESKTHPVQRVFLKVKRRGRGFEEVFEDWSASPHEERDQPKQVHSAQWQDWTLHADQDVWEHHTRPIEKPDLTRTSSRWTFILDAIDRLAKFGASDDARAHHQPQERETEFHDLVEQIRWCVSWRGQWRNEIEPTLRTSLAEAIKDARARLFSIHFAMANDFDWNELEDRDAGPSDFILGFRIANTYDWSKLDTRISSQRVQRAKRQSRVKVAA